MTNPPVEQPSAGPWAEYEPTDAELLGMWPDPLAGPPDGPDAWLADLSLPELDTLAAQWAAGDGTGDGTSAGPLGAGFTHDLPSEGAVGFAAGGALDTLIPGPVLAGFTADATGAGLGKLSDDELVGLLCAARRLSSWQAAIEFKVVAELNARRTAQAKRPGSSRLAEHVSAELAAALTLTARSADALLDLTGNLTRLPMVLTALEEGRIDRARAVVLANELAALDLITACAIAAALIRGAGRMTTGQLRAAIRALILSADPDAARRRATKARADARVEAWQETSGNSALAGRELPAAEMIAADKRITAIAQALKKAGAPGNLDQLRAAVFTALLTGRDPQTLLPASPRSQASPGSPGRPDSPSPGWLTGLTGTINLTMPLSAWQGLSDAPGETAGLGPTDAGTCRDLARSMAASPATRWCLTITDDDGKAAGHSCARTSHSKDPPGTVAWLTSLTVTWLERGDCTHRRQTGSYRPGPALRHLVKIRHRTCASPGCRRPAEQCDDDHTQPFDQGGRTCECNLAPQCRRHHRCKQAPGWHLTQTTPGHLTWTTPSRPPLHRGTRQLPDLSRRHQRWLAVEVVQGSKENFASAGAGFGRQFIGEACRAEEAEGGGGGVVPGGG